MSDANKAEVEVELNATGNAEQAFEAAGDAADVAAKKVDALKKAIADAAKEAEKLRSNGLLDEFMAGGDGPVTPRDLNAGRGAKGRRPMLLTQDERDLQNRERAFNRSIRFGKQAPTREELDQAADARRAERERQRMRQAKPMAPQEERDSKFLAQRDEHERRNQLLIDTGRKAGPKVPLTPEQADAKYLDGLRESERKKQLAVAAGLRKGEQEPHMHIPQTAMGMAKLGATKAGEALGVGPEAMAAAGLMAAAAAAGFYIGKEVMAAVSHMTGALNRVDATAYSTEASRKAARTSSLPVIGSVLDQSKSVAQNLSGYARQWGQFKENQAYYDVAVPGLLEHRVKESRYEVMQAEGMAKMETARDYQPYSVTGPRDTLSERREFQERKVEESGINRERKGSALQEAVKRQLEALKAQDAALAQATKGLTLERSVLQAEVDKSKKRDEGTRVPILVGGVVPVGSIDFSIGDSAATLDKAQKVQNIDKRIVNNEELRRANAEAQKTAEEKLASAASETASGRIDRMRGQQSLAESRAQAAQSMDERLGRMGPAGRMTGAQEFQNMKLTDLTNVSAAMFPHANEMLPETTSRMWEEAGRRNREPLRQLAFGHAVI